MGADLVGWAADVQFAVAGDVEKWKPMSAKPRRRWLRSRASVGKSAMVSAPEAFLRGEVRNQLFKDLRHQHLAC